MATPKKPRADAKLKNLPDAAQEELWGWLHPQDPERKPMTLEEAQGEIPLRHGFTVSLSALSEWRAWYALRRRMEMASERADQARLELAKDPSITTADLERVAQAVFTAETLQAGDVKGYVALAKLRLAGRALDHDHRKIELLEKKAEFADLVKKAAENSTGGVTAEQMAEIERKLKLL